MPNPPRIKRDNILQDIANRTIREIQGSRIGHSYLQQHQPEAIAQSYGTREANGGGVSIELDNPVITDVIDITGIFIVGVSTMGSTTDLVA
jgi:hypothetical protein